MNNIYSRIRKLEADILQIFIKEVGLRGSTGLTGRTELDIAIGYLNSAKNMLVAIIEKRKILGIKEEFEQDSIIYGRNGRD